MHLLFKLPTYHDSVHDQHKTLYKKKRIKITIVEHVDAVSIIQNTFYGHNIWHLLEINELKG